MSSPEASKAVNPVTWGKDVPNSIQLSCKTDDMTDLNRWLSLSTHHSQKDEKKYSPLDYVCENGLEEAIRKVHDHIFKNKPPEQCYTHKPDGLPYSRQTRLQAERAGFEQNYGYHKESRRQHQPHLGVKEKWWSRLVSNQRPPQCHCGALPTELRPHQGDGDCMDSLLTVKRFF